MEVEPTSSTRKSQSVLDRIIEEAEIDRIKTKQNAEQLKFGRDFKLTRKNQECWAARFNTFREYTLQQSLASTPTGEDILRFFDGVIDKIDSSFADKPS